MSGARGAVLDRVRGALGRTSEEDARAAERVDARLADPQPNLIPDRTDLPPAALLDLFVQMAERVQADVVRVEGWTDLPKALADYLRQRNMPQKAVVAPDPKLDGCNWGSQPLLRVRRGAAEPADTVGVTRAVGGVAETGTLVLASSPERPTMTAYLPETCVVALEASAVVGSYEEAWVAAMRDLGRVPRSVNMITGPSRTADIAQELQLGAHGPKRLAIVLVGNAG